ncbi:hypothetical protein [Methanobrevibacter sp.]
MRKQEFEVRTKVIRETFDDTRPIKCSVNIEELNLAKHIHPEGDIFLTQDCEFIDLEIQTVAFTESELVKYVELAEELYEKSQKEVSIYILCPRDVPVYMNEFDIPSDAKFTIRLACVQNTISENILDLVKNKIRNNEMLTPEDISHLASIPLRCRKEDRNHYREEVFKIINKLHY